MLKIWEMFTFDEIKIVQVFEQGFYFLLWLMMVRKLFSILV
ncbi:MAG: hypothetical protein ACOYOK_01765 [Pseudobdellovibrionaceae bacterium]